MLIWNYSLTNHYGPGFHETVSSDNCRQSWNFAKQFSETYFGQTDDQLYWNETKWWHCSVHTTDYLIFLNNSHRALQMALHWQTVRTFPAKFRGRYFVQVLKLVTFNLKDQVISTWLQIERVVSFSDTHTKSWEKNFNKTSFNSLECTTRILGWFVT